MVALLTFTDVVKRYPRGREHGTVLDGVSFSIETGEFIGVSGAARSGKTTLLRLAAGLEVADAGTVVFDGHDLARLSMRGRARLLRERIGFASTERRPARNEYVVDHVATPLLFAGRSRVEAAIEARRVLGRLDVTELGEVLTNDLSSAEWARVTLAQALVRNPALLLIDEPLIAPSPSERDEIEELLKTLGSVPWGEGGRPPTIILTSADIAAVRCARRAWRIGDGRVRTTDRPGTIVAFPARAPGEGRAGSA